MRLDEISPPRGAKSSPKRKGRGIATGQGKTAGRGHKGQNARSGGGVSIGFEGGQLPLNQRVPKRGFTNKFSQKFTEINVKSLNQFKEGSVVTPQELLERGVVKGKNQPIKILGEGELNRKLEVHAHAFSRTAAQKIEDAGGKVEVL